SGITQAGFAILERVESGLCEAPGSIREPHVARRVVNANNAGRLKVRPRYGVARLTISKKHDGRRYGFGFTLLTAAGRLRIHVTSIGENCGILYRALYLVNRSPSTGCATSPGI